MSLDMDQKPSLYDIFLTGQLTDGTDTQTAITNLAKLFKSTTEKIAPLFNGKPQALKRGLDKAQALKYKAALHRAGVVIAFKAHQAPSPAANTHLNSNTDTSDPVAPVSAFATDTNAATSNNNELTTAPAGSNLLEEHEQRKAVEQSIDTSAIKMVSAFLEPEAIVREVPPAPDTSHLSAAAAGEPLLVDKPAPPPPLPLNLDNISIAPVGADLEQLGSEILDVQIDISGLTIAEAGADLLEGQVKGPIPAPPTTDHLSVSID